MFSNKRTLLSTVMASSVLVACGSDNKSNNNSNNQGNDDVNKDDSYTTVTIDASSREAYAYLDLDTAAVVSESDDWDIAFKRDGIIVNANKATAIADSQAEKYDGDDVIADAIVNATAETEEGDFLEVTTIEGEFVGSDVVPVITASDLYIYNGIIDPSDHGFSAQSDNYYYLTSGEGDSYAQMNVSSFEKSSPFAPYAFVANIDFYLEGDSGFAASVSSTWQLDFGATAVTCYDFDSASMVDCNGETWDLKADIVSDGQNSAYNIYINGGASGNGSALVAGPTTDDAFTSANPAKEFGIGFAYDADKAGSAFADNSWYAYDVLSEGNHYLWPNFITYVLDTDPASDTDEPFKLQVINYYDTDNTSGFVTIRFTELSNNGE